MKTSRKWEEEIKKRINKRPHGETTGTLENWRYDLENKVYWGNIYKDVRGRFSDGQYIHTSLVDKVEGDIVFTLNSTYKLGKPQLEVDNDE